MLARGLVVLSISFLLAACTHNGQPAELGVVPFSPTLLVGAGNPICARFAEAWTSHYSSTEALSEEDFDLTAVFPDAEHFRFPDGTQRSLYEQGFARVLDVDGDGISQVLYAEGLSNGWRDLGPSLYLFESVEAFLAASPSDQQAVRQQAGTLMSNLRASRMTENSVPIPSPLADLESHDVLRFMIDGDALYVLIVQKEGNTRQHAVGSSLYMLQGNSEPGQLCQVSLHSSEEARNQFISQSPFYNSLSPYYGGPVTSQMCVGTMGWTAAPLYEHFETVLHRPQYMRSTVGVGPAESTALSGMLEDNARELRYLSWGLSDPSSWNSYLQWQDSRNEFMSQLADYYQNYFAMNPEDATESVMDAYRFISDRLIYSQSQDGPLTDFAKSHELNFTNDITTYSPGELIDMTLNRALNEIPEQFTQASSQLGYETLRAAMYTEKPMNIVQGIAALLPSDGSNGVPQMRREYEWNMILLAALGNEEYMAFALSHGANVNSASNGFGKTPIMYAAQLNELKGLQLLLDSGAQINAATLGSGLCQPLERDNRTALMYAAEYGSLDVISLLLEAGADANARDSAGNDIRWYLARNVELNDQQKGTLDERL